MKFEGQQEKDRQAIVWYQIVGSEEHGVPSWYFDIIAARYLGVAPWDLSYEPDKKLWRHRALIAVDAEREAHEYQLEIQRQNPLPV